MQRKKIENIAYLYKHAMLGPARSNDLLLVCQIPIMHKMKEENFLA